MKEYGGFLPFELPYKKNNLIKKYGGTAVLGFDCARNALAFLCEQLKLSKLYIPYYNCEFVKRALEKHGIPFEQYYLGKNFFPDVEEILENEYLLYVNYFGTIDRNHLKAVTERYRRVIFDNTQAYFSPPVIKPDCYSIYSCRKFFGVSDGAYLICETERFGEAYDKLQISQSWMRTPFLLRSLEEGTNAAYADNLKNENLMDTEVQRISVLTERILDAVDYDAVRSRRDRNLHILTEKLGKYNTLLLPVRERDLMVYPFYLEDETLRKRLVKHKIYVPQWWKYLIGTVREDSLESRLSRYLYPLPIDQRYDTQDMENMADTVIRLLKEE